MESLALYFKAVQDALWAVHSGQPVERELELLAPLQLKLASNCSDFASLSRANLQKARDIYSVKSKHLRDNQHWLLTYVGGGEELIVGWRSLANHLNLSESSVGVMLSKGGGTSFNTRRASPLTGEQDIVTVWRINKHDPAPKPKRGRPRTRPLTETEFLQNQESNL